MLPGVNSPVPDVEAVSALVKWFADDGADLPWRRTRNRYHVLVAETMLQATPVARVCDYYTRWIARWPTPGALAEESVGEVLAAWHGLGYPLRARRLHAAATHIAEHGWPADDRLTDLPGVGSYTASAIRCFADEAPVLPVDVNVARILARRFPHGWPGAPTDAAWECGQAMMDLGRTICTARAPRCDDGCPVRVGCPAADAGTVAEVTPMRRPQGRYEGSMRQRRGVLMGRLARDGSAAVADDHEAAESLVRDGLAQRAGDRLLRAGAEVVG